MSSVRVVVVGASVLLVASILLVGCSADPPEELARSRGGAVAPVVDGDSVVFLERLTGRVRRVRLDGTAAPDPFAPLATAAGADDQRGALGLAHTRAGRWFASWTRAADGRLVVGELLVDAEPRLVWIGPLSAQLANGGTLAVRNGDEVLIGVGDLMGPRDLLLDPSVPNGKILALDIGVDSDPSALPSIVSSGWNNPFALATAVDGTIWVADNTGGNGDERIGRGDRPASEAAPLGLDEQVAPSALVALDADRLAMCSYLGRKVLDVAVAGGTPRLGGQRGSIPCATGLAVTDDGRLVTAATNGIYVDRR